jgi:hypothetical protein
MRSAGSAREIRQSVPFSHSPRSGTRAPHQSQHAPPIQPLPEPRVPQMWVPNPGVDLRERALDGKASVGHASINPPKRVPTFEPLSQSATPLSRHDAGPTLLICPPTAEPERAFPPPAPPSTYVRPAQGDLVTNTRERPELWPVDDLVPIETRALLEASNSCGNDLRRGMSRGTNYRPRATA